ncbi:small-conductance mechanosensitive channel [Halorubrum aidingense JCM 13560]|uniref:Small-conductance mechanosensitive channel n=1 Tax=Halorubrum aidingense JCM 13560 TaxID=1230454 RepID=M0PAD7_9EURY|nr:mechanosensitive ion channel family protein [Halorubrum aidingense]EMA66828.1 small-conductance mechanosensitive channel [Halorubrum aidingense JCM 13560]
MLPESLGPVLANPYGATLFVLVASVLAGAVMNFVVVRHLRRYTDRTATDYDSIVVDNLHIPLVTTASLIGFSVLASVPSVTENTFLTAEQVSTFVGRPAITVIVLVWAFYLNRVVNRLVTKINEEGKASDTRGRAYEFAPVFSNIWTLTVVVAGTATVLLLWEYDISPLLGAAGIAGIALGFAAKESVGNFLGGLALYVDDTYTIGDYLEIDTGEAGTVVAVGIRSTTLRTRDNIDITLPNSMLNEERVVNLSAPHGQTRLKIDVGVAYGSDIDLVEDVLVGIAEDEESVPNNPAPRARFVGFGDSALEYRLVCWVTRPEHMGRVRHRLNREIYLRFADHGIEIPYATHDVNVRHVTAASVPESNPVAAPDPAVDPDPVADPDAERPPESA